MFVYERIFIGGIFRHNTRFLKHFLGLFLREKIVIRGKVFSYSYYNSRHSISKSQARRNEKSIFN